MSFRPTHNSRISIENVNYRFLEHPSAKGMPYGQTGRRATVYQVQDDVGELKALKVFTSAFRSIEIESNASVLRKYSHLPGMGVCTRRVLTQKNEPLLILQYPDLEYSVLMPWAKGQTWQEILLARQTITPEESLSISRKFSSVLCALEENNIAHCDLSGPNVLVANGATFGEDDDFFVSVVDIEDLYADGLVKPTHLPGGSVGYGHKVSKLGSWKSTADRFAGAILLA